MFFFFYYYLFVFVSNYLMHSNKGSLSCRWQTRLHKNNDEGRGVRRFVAFLDPTFALFWRNIFVRLSCSDGEGDVCDQSLKVTEQ